MFRIANEVPVLCARLVGGIDGFLFLVRLGAGLLLPLSFLDLLALELY